MVSKNFSNYVTVHICLNTKIMKNNLAIWMYRYLVGYLDWHNDRNKEYHVRKKSGEEKKLKALTDKMREETIVFNCASVAL